MYGDPPYILYQKIKLCIQNINHSWLVLLRKYKILLSNFTKCLKPCQEWDSNPCPFGPVPETGALDQLGHLDICEKLSISLI